MMWIVYGAIIGATVLTLFVASRRRMRGVDETVVTTYDPPVKIERNDFPQQTTENLVVVFTSQVCDSCVNVRDKANILQSDFVDVAIVEYEDPQGKKLHAKYQIEAVPTLVICNGSGVVLNSYVGHVSATDLWADVARARGASIEDCTH